jgi:hypothetical protein
MEKRFKKTINLDQSYSHFNAILIRPIIDVDIGGQISGGDHLKLIKNKVAIYIERYLRI